MGFADLDNIENPIARLVAGSISGATIVGILTGVGLGLSGAKGGHSFALLATLAGSGGGAVATILTSPTVARQKKEDADRAVEPETNWQDWRNFTVRRKVVESSEITSFYLEPADGGGGGGGSLPGYEPGQFLTIKLDIPGQSRPTIRTYSLSDWSIGQGYYRLSIKREGSPEGQDVPPGLASNFMHDRVEVGTVIAAKPPKGKFVLDPAATIPVVLLSNGVGITPTIAMAKAIARQNPQRPVWFLHGARDGDTHAFREEIAALAQQDNNLHVRYYYSRPRPEDADRYDVRGYVDKDAIETEILPAIARASGDRAAEYYLCGSPAFMDSLLSGLDELGVPSERVFFESFSGSKPKSAAPAAAEAGEADEKKEVVFAKSGKTATWTPAAGTLLEFAEAQGIDAPYSCRQGLCLTCMCDLVAGEVEYEEPPVGEPDAGAVLVCVSKPKSDRVELQL